MKRKITNLEQRLIDKGYYLSHKQYSGRKSEKTHSYTYVNKNTFVKLDFKREKVISYGLLNYSAMELTRMELQGIEIVLSMIENEIKERQPREITPLLNRPLESTWERPSEYDENEELGEMTFEQFDELCKEKEND